MLMLDKFKKGAQKAGIQATAFVQAGSTKVASGSRDFVQGFSLPGEAEKAANILDSFLGTLNNSTLSATLDSKSVLRASIADPERPESALNSIPKVVLQRARGTCLS